LKIYKKSIEKFENIRKYSAFLQVSAQMIENFKFVVGSS